jgi:hypothetical protein
MPIRDEAVIDASLTMDAVSTRLKLGSIKKFRGALSRAKASGKDEVKHEYFYYKVTL